MDSVNRYRDEADRCRRLARMINDPQAVDDLTTLAAELEAKATAAEARIACEPAPALAPGR